MVHLPSDPVHYQLAHSVAGACRQRFLHHGRRHLLYAIVGVHLHDERSPQDFGNLSREFDIDVSDRGGRDLASSSIFYIFQDNWLVSRRLVGVGSCG